jgi:hypothetical protein
VSNSASKRARDEASEEADLVTMLAQCFDDRIDAVAYHAEYVVDVPREQRLNDDARDCM